MTCRRLGRRAFIKAAAFAAGAAGLGVTAALDWLHLEANRLIVNRVTVPLPRLPSPLHGLTIVHLSDIHIRTRASILRARRTAAMVNELQPDLVAITGDNVLISAEGAWELGSILAGLQVRLGVFASPGNHDRWTNLDVVRRALEAAGATMLVNEGRVVSVGDAQLYVAGLDDVYYGHPDLQRALAGVNSSMPVIALVHEPDLADRFACDGRISLQLSGHSHGGQVCLPNAKPLLLPRYAKKYVQGLHRVGNGWVYTTRGVGTCPPDIRLNCPPEVTHITLVAEEKPEG